MSIVRERVSVVWLGLMVLTCATTWGLSKDHFVPAVAVAGVFVIAAVKVSYVMLDFMELRYAPIPGTRRLPGLVHCRRGGDRGFLVRHFRRRVSGGVPRALPRPR